FWPGGHASLLASRRDTAHLVWRHFYGERSRQHNSPAWQKPGNWLDRTGSRRPHLPGDAVGGGRYSPVPVGGLHHTLYVSQQHKGSVRVDHHAHDDALADGSRLYLRLLLLRAPGHGRALALVHARLLADNRFHLVHGACHALTLGEVQP